MNEANPKTELEELNAKYGSVLDDFLRAFAWALRWKQVAKRYRVAVENEDESAEVILLRQHLADARRKAICAGISVAEIAAGKWDAGKQLREARNENAHLRAELEAVRKIATDGVDHCSAKSEQRRREIVELKRELEAARKVADAAVRWLGCRDNGNDEAEDGSWAALRFAVREYRQRCERTNEYKPQQ